MANSVRYNFFLFILLIHAGVANIQAQTYKVFFEPMPDVLPTFHGGDINEYIRNNLDIPITLPKLPAHSIVKFTITKRGKIKKCRMEQTSGIKEVDNRILAVVKKMPDWGIGKKKGKNVNVDVYIPIYVGVHYHVDVKKRGEISDDNKLIKVNDSIQKEIWIDKFEEYPQFVGGRKKLIDFFERNTMYPVSTIEGDLGGYSVVRFTVTDLGEIESVRLVRGFDPAADKEALRAVKSMPLWLPAKVNGEKISSDYQIVIFFDIGEAKKNRIRISKDTLIGSPIMKYDYRKIISPDIEKISITPIRVKGVM